MDTAANVPLCKEIQGYSWNHCGLGCLMFYKCMALCTSALKCPDLYTKIQCVCRILIILLSCKRNCPEGFSVLWHCPYVVCNVQDMLSMHCKSLDWPLQSRLSQWPGHDAPSSAQKNVLKGHRFESDKDVRIVMVPAIGHGFFADKLHWLFCQWAAFFCADDCF